VAVFHVFDATNAVAANALRGYKKALVPMIAFAVGLWLVGLGGGYLLAFSDTFAAPLGARGFWLGAIAGMAIAAFAVTSYFARVSRAAMENAARRKSMTNTPSPKASHA
jgi:MATE family multidrug resistance protein